MKTFNIICHCCRKQFTHEADSLDAPISIRIGHRVHLILTCNINPELRQHSFREIRESFKVNVTKGELK